MSLSGFVGPSFDEPVIVFRNLPLYRPCLLFLFYVFYSIFTEVFRHFTLMHKVLGWLYCDGFGFCGKEVGGNAINLIIKKENSLG